MAKKKASTNSQTTALLYIVIGVLFLFFNHDIINWMMMGIGALFILNGILDISKKRTVNGVVNVVIGIVVIILGAAVVDLVLKIFGILLALKGILDLAGAAKRKKVVAIIATLLTIAIGVLLVFDLYQTLTWFFTAIGIVLIVDGIISLVK